jgi:hypothetical protein
MLVYAVDVSMPPPFLAAAKAALAASLVARAVDHPASDVAVLAYGCRGEGVGGVDGSGFRGPSSTSTTRPPPPPCFPSETDNPCHAQDPTQFRGIVSQPDLFPVGAANLDFASRLTHASGAAADPLDAVAVATIMLDKAVAAEADGSMREGRRLRKAGPAITLLAAPGPGPAPGPDAEQADKLCVDIAARLDALAADLTIVLVAPPLPGGATRDAAASLRPLLAAAAPGRTAVRVVATPGALAGALATPSVSRTPYYSGPLHLTDHVSIPVKVAKAVMAQKAPSWVAVPAAPAAGDGAAVDAGARAARPEPSFRRLDAEGEQHGPSLSKDAVVRAARYGGDLVPLDADTAALTSLKAERGLRLLGFADPPDPRWLAADGALLIAPADGGRAALSALVRAAAAKNKVAILRWVGRTNGTPKLLAAFPEPGRVVDEADGSDGGRDALADPDVFFGVALPYADDARHPAFPTLPVGPDNERAPTEKQQAAADALVRGWRVDAGPPVAGRPFPPAGAGVLPNPVRARALAVAGDRVLGLTRGVPAAGETAVGAALEPPATADAAAALASFDRAFDETWPEDADADRLSLTPVGKKRKATGA